MGALASSISAHVCRCPRLAIRPSLLDIQVKGVGVLLLVQVWAFRDDPYYMHQFGTLALQLIGLTRDQHAIVLACMP